MDPYEATKAVFSRIQALDPDNASRIMGLLLIQDHGEKEMIRLAFGPESLLHSVVVKARQELGVASTTLNTGSPAAAANGPNPLSRQNSSTGSSRFVPNGLKIPASFSLTSLASPSSSPSWAGPNNVFPEFVGVGSEELVSPSSGSVSGGGGGGVVSSSGLNPSTPPFYGSGRVGVGLVDEVQLQEQQLSSFLADNGVGSTWGGLPHKRSCSVNDINLGSLLDDPSCGFGWKPCLYYARGFCKNGSSCRFVHGSDTDSGAGAGAATHVGSPSKLEMMEQCHELLRSKSMQHQNLVAAAAMAATASPPSPSFPYPMNKGLSLFAQQQQSDSPRAAALMMGEELNKFNRSRLDNIRSDPNPASRQIYLTFPADSTFREEDVSNYFSLYGPVQDVRIPYQQKRMFGFVTFVYPETVKMILAKGNPHFVCDARVLVKPYKEKGKVPDKFRKQQMERGEFSVCNSPTALDSRDPFDLQLGARMLYDTQYMLWKRKLEQEADLQQALELQSRRLMGLQLLDVKRNHHHHHRSLSTGAPVQSPTQSPNSIFNQPLLGSDRSSPDAPDENCLSPPLDQAKQAVQQAINEVTHRDREGTVGDHNSNGDRKEGPYHQDNNVPESSDHNLPDSPFASPMKGANEFTTAFSGGSEAENTSIPATTPSANCSSNTSSFLPSSSTLDLGPLRSCYFQMPRFSPGHGAVGM